MDYILPPKKDIYGGKKQLFQILYSFFIFFVSKLKTCSYGTCQLTKIKDDKNNEHVSLYTKV